MRSAWTEHAHLFILTSLFHFPGTTWITMPKSITSSSIPEFFNAPSTAMTPPLRDRVLASWDPMGFSGRGKPLALWGGTGASPLEKRERGLPGTPDAACGHPERDLVVPCVVSSTRSWGVPFFLGQNLREGQWSPGRKPPLRGTPESLVISTPERHPPLPRGLDHWGEFSRRSTVEKGGKQDKANW